MRMGPKHKDPKSSNSKPEKRYTAAEMEYWRNKAIGKRLIVGGETVKLPKLRERISFYKEIVSGEWVNPKCPPEKYRLRLEALSEEEARELANPPPQNPKADTDFHVEDLPGPLDVTGGWRPLNLRDRIPGLFHATLDRDGIIISLWED